MSYRKPPTSPRRAGCPARTGRKGVAAILAMLFLVLFASLAVAFYSLINTSALSASNERRASTAILSAETGMAFITHHLSSVSLPLSQDTTVLFNGIASSLTSRLSDTQNCVDASTGTLRNPTRLTYADGTTALCVPGHTLVNSVPRLSFMRLGENAGQAALLLRLTTRQDPAQPTNPAARVPALVLTVIGRSDGASPVYRAIEYELSTRSGRSAWEAPTGTIITYSPVNFSGGGVAINASITAITSLTPLTMGGGGNTINGVFSYPANSPKPVGTTSNGNSVRSIITLSESPAPPTIDTTIFASLVPGPAETGTQVIRTSWNQNQTLTNIRIKANTNPTFSNMTINGVIYVESPNVITIAGGSKVNGVIVSDNNSAVPYNNQQYTPNNKITLNNGSTLNGTTAIDLYTVPAAEREKIATLQSMTTGSMVLAPNYALQFAGGLSMQTSAAIVGAAVQFDNIGSPTTFNGTILSLGSTPFNVYGGIGLNSGQGTQTWPGLYSGGVSFGLNRSSYSEVSPWDHVQP